jgi:hypothetical protein
VVKGLDTLKSKDLEFIEFKNTGSSALNLSVLTIDSAVSYTFPENTILPPGQFYVVASSPGTFYDFYAIEANGNFKGNLSNGGEQLVVVDRNANKLIDMTFLDSDPWPDKADGDGPSLASVHFNPTENPADPAYWRISIYDGGTPFRDDELITALKTPEEISAQFKIYPNPSQDHFSVSVPQLTNDALLNIKMYDLNGRLELERKIPNHGEIKISKNLIHPGLKVLTIEHSDFFISQKLVVSQ